MDNIVVSNVFCSNCGNIYDIVDNGNKKASYICKLCNNMKSIKSGEVIISSRYKYTNDKNENLDEYRYLIYDPIVNRTKNYICRNKNCKFDDPNKEAAMMTNTLHRLVMQCTLCEHIWIEQN